MSESITALLRLLETQLHSFLINMAAELGGELSQHSGPQKWSAREQLAHLGRYHEISLVRIERILRELNPLLDRYRAEEDPGWPEWQSLSARDIIARLQILRKELVGRVRILDTSAFERTGVHPRFGALTLKQWLEFFLVHEGHHLYAIFGLVCSRPAGN